MWAHRTPHQPALFTWRPRNPLRSEVSKPLSDNKRPTKERKERERDTRLHSLHKSWMKTVFFCNLIWEMLIERQGWEGVQGGGLQGLGSLCSLYYDWLRRLAPLIHWLDAERRGATDWQGKREGEGASSRHLWVNLNKRYLKRKRCR